VPSKIASLEIDAANPIVESLSTDEVLLGLWGFLRLASAPMSLSQIADGAQMDPAVVQRKLDVLVAYGILEALPARSRRRGIGYRVLHGGLRVRFPRSGSMDLLRKIAAAMQSHVQKLLMTQFMSPETKEGWGWHADFTGTFNLRPDEVNELRHRLNRLVEFTNVLAEKYAARGQSPEMCNYAMHFRVEPLAKPTLPLAPVRYVLEGAEQTADAHASGERKKTKLSARERQVALALLRGLTLEEVGAQLGIARNTAATMTKRIYAKLGVHRRAELVARLQEELGDTPPPPPR
jgi:DNA-binding CsgD family transcriptional regulator/DNA-binding Lrp family transcriptional regulator